MNFGGLLLTGPICHINVGTGVGVVGAATYTGATALTPFQVTTTPAAAATTAVTANAANQALVAQQAVAAAAAAAAAALAATLPTKFNSNNLPPKAKACYENHLNPSYLMTKTDMQPFPTPTGGVCPSLSYLNPPMGSFVT